MMECLLLISFNILSTKVDISLQILAMLINFEVVLTLISLYIEKSLLSFGTTTKINTPLMYEV